MTGEQRAQKATDERATVGPADEMFGVEMKVDFVKRLGAADDHPIVSEEEPAQGGDHRNGANVDDSRPVMGIGIEPAMRRIPVHCHSQPVLR